MMHLSYCIHLTFFDAGLHTRKPETIVRCMNISTLRRQLFEALDNAYSVLGLQPGATDEEIKSAWKDLTFQYRGAKAAGDPFANVKIAHLNKAVRHLLGAAKETGQAEFAGYEGPSVVMPEREPGAPKKKAVRVSRTSDSYKVYPWKDKRKVVRIKGKLFGTEPGGNLRDGGQTKFASAERATTSTDRADGRLSVTKTDGSDHTQTWDPVDEAFERVAESLLRMAKKG